MAALGQMPAMFYNMPAAAQAEDEPPQASPFPFGTVGGQDVDQTQLQGYMDPRRALWGGFMMDMANHFLSGRQAGLSGLGPQSMFQAIRGNQQLEQMERQRMQQAQQAINPFKDFPAAYQSFKLAEEAGYEGSFPDFLAMAKNGQSNRPVKTWTGENGNMWYLDANGNAIDTNVKGSPPGFEIKMVGDVPYVESTLPGGEVKFETLNDFQRRYRGDLISSEERIQTQAQKWATADATFEQEMPGMYGTLERQLDLVDSLLADIESGKYQDTGYFEGRYRQRLTEEGAYLNSANTRQTLENLKIVNLAPVTENEFAKLSEMFISVLQEPEANIGVLRENRDFLQRSLDALRPKLEYFYGPGNRSMRDYGAQRWAPQPDTPPVTPAPVINLSDDELEEGWQ